jgi:hypothetical protein
MIRHVIWGMVLGVLAGLAFTLPSGEDRRPLLVAVLAGLILGAVGGAVACGHRSGRGGRTPASSGNRWRARQHFRLSWRSCAAKKPEAPAKEGRCPSLALQADTPSSEMR